MTLTRENFIKIIDAIDEYYCGDVAQARAVLGIGECVTNELMDIILDAISETVDPKRLAAKDENTSDCGDYICTYLFAETEFQEICPTAGALYDYIKEKYSDAHNEDSAQIKANI